MNRDPINYPAVDIIIPLFNEEEALPILHVKLCAVVDDLHYRFTFIYVDDGSSDNTRDVISQLSQTDARVSGLWLSRNFGHQAALTAGLDQARGDYVITMDGDGQHPPEMIPEMLRLAKDGYEVVIAQRDADNATSFKNLTSRLFYKLINAIGDTNIQPGAADFRLLSKTVVDSLRAMREYHRLLRGMVAWMGFRSIIIPYHQPARIGGKSKYSLRKMVSLAAHATFSFSLIPLYLGISVGVLFLLLALIEIIYVSSFWISGTQASLAPGWSSLMFVLLCVGGSLMITLGFVGIYVGYIFQQVKGRPIYIVRDKLETEILNHRNIVENKESIE